MQEELFNQELGARIRAARQRAGLTQEDLAATAADRSRTSRWSPPIPEWFFGVCSWCGREQPEA